MLAGRPNGHRLALDSGQTPFVRRLSGCAMGTKLSRQDEELYRRTDEVLHYLWDPCGISGAPQARDEYYGYLPEIFNLLKQGADAIALSRHLSSIESDRMGMSGAQDRHVKIGEILVGWRGHIAETHGGSG